MIRGGALIHLERNAIDKTSLKRQDEFLTEIVRAWS